MSSVRQEILTFLHHHPGTTSGELARSLDVTPADVRHHLRKLHQDGLVQVVGERSTGVQGRPSRVYTLARLGDGLPMLLSTLLSVVGRDAESQENVIHQVVEALVGDLVGDTRRIATTQRLVQAVQRLNQLHYHARWEARPAAPQIILGHCPYASIVANHPELCTMDSHLIARLAGQPAVHTIKQEPNQQGVPVCIFILGRR